MKRGYVYIIANKPNGTIYVGVTSNLTQRIWQHKEGLAMGFTRQYGLKSLVWYEIHDFIESAITREKQLKIGKESGSFSLLKQRIPIGKTCTNLFYDWFRVKPGMTIR